MPLGLQPDAVTGLFMSTSVQTTLAKKKAQPSKYALPVKIATKSQPSGLSREEIRQIVLEMIG
jgi:hypothetical protein